MDTTDPLYALLAERLPAVVAAAHEMRAMLETLGDWLPDALTLLEAIAGGYAPPDLVERAATGRRAYGRGGADSSTRALGSARVHRAE
jgi:hypothetical protein